MKFLFCCLWLGCMMMTVVAADDFDWHRTGPVAPSIEKIIADRLHPGVWYLLTAEQDDYYYGSNRLYRSLDNGQTWKYIGMKNVRAIVLHSGSSELFITRDGRSNNYYRSDLLSSTDFGETFQLRSTHAPAKIFDHPSDPRILWGSRLSYDDDDVSVSYDRGAHWQAFRNLPTLTYNDYGEIYTGDYYLQSLLVSPLNPKIIYLSSQVEFDIGCGGESIDLAVTSFDGGKSWSYAVDRLGNFFYDPAFPDRAFFSNYEETRKLTANGWKPLVPRRLDDVVSVPGKPDELYTLFDGKQWVSKNGGSTWNRISLGPGGRARLLVARSSPENTFLAGTNAGGVYIIDSSRNFRQVTIGFTQASLYDVSTAFGSHNVFAISGSRDGFLFASGTSGKSWKNITSNLPASPAEYSQPRVFADPHDGRHVFAEVNDRIVVSFDAGASWMFVPEKPLSRVFPEIRSGRTFFAKTGDAHLYESTDGGRTVRQLPASFGSSRNTIYDLAIDPFNGDFFAATEEGLFVSRDEGLTAQQIATELNPDCPQCLNFRQIVALPLRGQYIAVVYNGMFKTVNQGVTWQSIGGPSGTVYVADDQGQHLFVINGALWETTDGGVNWTRISSTIDPQLGPNHDGQILAMTDPRFRPLYVATTIGMYRTD